MLDHQKFILYHIEKSGGTFILELFINIGIKGKITKGHEFYKPNSKNKKKAKIGMIRNPYSFYLSLWAYGCQKKGNFYHRHMKLYPDEEYFYSDAYNYQNFRDWLKRVLIYNPENPMRIKPFDFSKINQYDIGLLTIEVIDTYFQGVYQIISRIGNENEKEIKNDFNFFIKIEEWKNILPEIIKKLKLKNEINISRYNSILDKKTAKILNQSQHDSIDKYYDQEMIELVNQKDRFVFEYFDYSFLNSHI